MSISPTELRKLDPDLYAHVEANYNFRAPIYLMYAHFTKENQSLVLRKATDDALLDVSDDPSIQATKKVAAYILQNNLGFQHEWTDGELKQFYQATLDYIRPFYPELFSQISLGSSETEITSFLNSLILSIARKCFSVFSEIIEQKKHSLPDPMINFFGSIKSIIDSPAPLNFPDCISQTTPYLQPFQQFILIEFNLKTNHKASSLEEMYAIQLQQSIEDFLLPYLVDPASFNSQNFLSSLCRQSFSRLFYKGILEDVKTNKESSKSLKILDLLIQDYISASDGGMSEIDGSSELTDGRRDSISVPSMLLRDAFGGGDLQQPHWPQTDVIDREVAEDFCSYDLQQASILQTPVSESMPVPLNTGFLTGHSNGHLWRHSAGLNYGYALKSIDDAVEQNSLETAGKMLYRFQAASQVLNIFESLLDNFVEHFDQVRNMIRYLPALLFTDIHTLLESIKQSSSQIKIDSSILSMQAGFLKAVIEEAAPQLGPFEKDLALFQIRLRCLAILGTLPVITLNPQQQEIIKTVSEVFDASSTTCHQKLSEVKKMRQGGYHTNNNCSLLGIGFTGCDFEEEKKATNTVFLNFSLTMRSRYGEISGSALLYATQCFFLLHPTSQTPIFTVEIIENADQDDLVVFDYIVHHIVKTITAQPSPAIHKDILESFGSAFKDLLERQKTKLSRDLQSIEKKLVNGLASYQQIEDYHHITRIMIPDCDMLTIDQRITISNDIVANSAKQLITLYAKKEKLTKQQEEKRLELAHCKEMLGRLQNNNYALDPDYLIKLVDEKKDRICVEPVISRMTGNPYTLSFAMSENIGEPIFLNQQKFPLGANRPLIQPCNLKCQLFSPAHMLWAELTHFPTAQQAHERSEKKGGPGLASVFS